MKRYIVSRDAIKALNLRGLKECYKELAKPIRIKEEKLTFRNFKFISLKLTDTQVKTLKQQGLFVEEEIKEKATLGTDYQKQASMYIKAKKGNFIGRGCKIAILDSGCNFPAFYDVGINLADANPDITDYFGHGGLVNSIIKSPQIGIANGAQVHHLRVIDNTGTINGTAVLAALDYCIDNDIDIINMSWSMSGESLRLALIDVVADGIVCVAATGNNTGTPSEMSRPATYQGVVAVNSIREDGTVGNSSVSPPFGLAGAHGVDFACNGVFCEVVNGNGTTTLSSGTSYSAPFFVGLFACHKEKMGITNNYTILQQIKNTAISKGNSMYFGLGHPIF